MTLEKLFPFSADLIVIPITGEHQMAEVNDLLRSANLSRVSCNGKRQPRQWGPLDLNNKSYSFCVDLDYKEVQVRGSHRVQEWIDQYFTPGDIAYRAALNQVFHSRFAPLERLYPSNADTDPSVTQAEAVLATEDKESQFLTALKYQTNAYLLSKPSSDGRSKARKPTPLRVRKSSGAVSLADQP